MQCIASMHTQRRDNLIVISRDWMRRLERRGGGIAGHLRPDLYTVIYALDILGTDGGGLFGVSFHDASGAAVFSVFVPGEGAPPTASALRQFRETAALMRALPGLCPR